MSEENQNTVPSAQAPSQERRDNRNSGNRNSYGPRGNANAKNNGGRRSSSRYGRREEDEFQEKVVKISRVTKVVKGGKRMRFTALVVIGDGKGRYGYGLGKSAAEVPEAIKKAVSAAKKDLHKIELTKENSIRHEVVGEFGATKVFLKPAPEGTGLIAGGAVRAILELAGVKNVYSKIYGSRTKSNVVKATSDGLQQLKSPAQVKAARFANN